MPGKASLRSGLQLELRAQLRGCNTAVTMKRHGTSDNRACLPLSCRKPEVGK